MQRLNLVQYRGKTLQKQNGGTSSNTLIGKTKLTTTIDKPMGQWQHF
jgi:hypothetical protein